jgi:hypothetical protein
MKAQNSSYRIKELLGWLGLLLPYVLLSSNAILLSYNKKTNDILLPSISDYHYSYVGIVFTGILMAFGLLLISYKGMLEENTFWTDNRITNIAGVLAIVVVCIPTRMDKVSAMITPNAHNADLYSTLHLSAAGLFLVLIGVLSFSKFSKSTKRDVHHSRRKKLYKLCGVGVWLSVATLVVMFLFSHYGEFEMGYWVFILEAVALLFFGTAWLVKAKTPLLYYVGVVSQAELDVKRGELGR